jgi:pyruvate/2-oxoglutarate dehydrogenase complex dihydrolipoamide acyltransferase (E2) component
MHGLIDVDVTLAMERLEALDPPASLTAFVLASVARAAAAHPEVHAYRNWRGQLVTHHHVDVATLVEISTPQGLFPLAITVRDADVRDVSSLSVELKSVKHAPSTSPSGRLLERAGPVVAQVPGALPAMYAAIGRSTRLRQRTGTVSLTSIGMMAGGGGFGVTPLSLMSLQVVVGGMARRPRIVDGQVQARDVLDLTVTIDHNVVDGAPAARFGAHLRQLLETASVLET